MSTGGGGCSGCDAGDNGSDDEPADAIVSGASPDVSAFLALSQ